MNDLFEKDKAVFKFDKNKKIRFISLFSGVGFQELGLKYLGVEFEYHKAIEFDKHAIKAFNLVHNTDFPVTDITNVKGEDLEISHKDKYQYLMTYSFPCTDLSVSGAQKGMGKGSGTRSGLIWEVERLLNETTELPDVLIMENVAAVHSKKFMPDFQKWIDFLVSKGYSNYWQDLNTYDYGIPQSRNRCFMVSILGDYKYNFPKPIPLEKSLEDMLVPESEVLPKFYFNSDKTHKLIKDIIDKGELPYAEDNAGN